MDYKLSYLLDEFPDSVIDEEVAQAKTGLCHENLQRELKKLNTVLGLPKHDHSSEIYIPKLTSEVWTKLNIDLPEEPIYSEKERVAFIYLLAYSEMDTLSLFHFQDFLKVSKGTAISDVKKLRKYLADFGLTFTYKRSTGFLVTGDELIIRRVAKNLIAHLIQKEKNKYGLMLWLNMYSLSLYARTKERILKAVHETGLNVVPSRMNEVTIFECFTLYRMRKPYLKSVPELLLLQSLKAYQVSEKFLTLTYENVSKEVNWQLERAYFTNIVMTVTQGEVQDLKLDFLLNCSAEIIHNMERVSAIQFSNFRDLLINLFYHLVPAYFRIINGFYMPNVLNEEVQKEYSDIYEFTEESLKPLEDITGIKTPSEEIAFFSILFGGEISSLKEKDNTTIKALIVCPNGISSSLILQAELRRIFPTIIFAEASSVGQLQSVPEESYDVVFTTISIESNKQIFHVKPIMTQLEKVRLINQVQEKLLIPGLSLPSAKEIIDILTPYIDLKENVTKEKLYHVLHRKMNKTITEKEDNRPMLTELLTPDMIQLSDKKMNWEEAIHFAAQPLIDNDSIEPRYVEAMIDKVKQYGAFIHIGKGVALPHARPEDGVKSIGMSLLKTEDEVLLQDKPEHPIKIFVCIAAVDNEQHLRALASLTRLLSQKDSLDQLLNAATKEEIINILSKGEEES